MSVSQREADFQQAVLDLAQLAGWRVYHTYDSRRSNPGFPDLVLVKPPMVLFVELKTDKGRLTAEQQEWIEDLMRCTEVEAHVWRPQHWHLLEQVLTGVSS